MKNHRLRVLLILLCISAGVFLTSADIEPEFYGNYAPVYMKRAEMEKAVKPEAPRELQEPGKIYVYGKYILVNEKYKGIHVIDNTNPANPQKIAFYHIDGCIDMAVKDNILYADNAVDLITLKPSADLKSFTLTSRLKQVFPEVQSPDGYNRTYAINKYRPEDGVLVGWKLRTK